MSLTNSKTDTRAEARTTIEAAVDDIAVLHERFLRAKKRVADFQKQLDSLLDPLQPLFTQVLGHDDGGTFEGNTRTMTVGLEVTKRTISDKDGLTDMLNSISEDLALELATFKMADIDAQLRPAELEQVITTEYTGKRRMPRFGHIPEE